jgi:hypothetical protein
MQIRSPEFDRRQVYRPLLERLNSMSSVRRLNGDDLIVPRSHDPLEAQEPPIHIAFAREAELTRGIQMALVGGIGSGKTTEMWLTERQLNRHPDAVNILVDIAEKTDIGELNTGAILATVGLELYARLKKKPGELSGEIASAYAKLRTLAYGKTDWVAEENLDDEDYGERAIRVDVPGLMRLRFPALRREVKEVKDLVDTITGPLVDQDAQITVLIDGLDRLSPERFREFTEQDLRAIKRTRISVVVVAPLVLWYDKSRFLQEYFDVVKYIPAVAPGLEGRSFLREILKRRGSSELMEAPQVNSIVKASGGVIRDLLTLVRTAASNAYGDDEDRVRPKHVNAAISQLGHRYLVGLGVKQRRILMRLEDFDELPTADPVALELLANRQILEHFDHGRQSFEVHPALKKVMPKRT